MYQIMNPLKHVLGRNKLIASDTQSGAVIIVTNKAGTRLKVMLTNKTDKNSAKGWEQDNINITRSKI